MEAAEILRERFGTGPDPVVARAPGRVNLIGEHTDYNEGFVLPFAVDRYTEVALRQRRDRKVLVYTSAFDRSFSCEFPLRKPSPRGEWSDYLLGILLELSKRGELPHGFEATITGNVPLGVGLSSSASLEVALAVGLSRLYGLELRGLELVELCQRAERDFVRMPCGIMDQYASYFGEPGKALFLDTRALKHEPVPLELPGVRFLIVDSGVRRALADSGYAQRRRECAEATRWLALRFPEKLIRSLRDAEREMLEEVQGEMPDILWKRAAHVVEENARVLEAVRALRDGDIRRVGELLTASHASLRDLFQVTTPELDFLVQWALEHGAFGARLVGGGFGGVTLHLVPEEDATDYVRNIRDAYRRRWARETQAIWVRPGPGARHLDC